MGKNFGLAIKYFESVLGQPLNQIPPVPLSGWETIEIVWPLNEVFRPFLTRICTVAYNQAFESVADKAIEDYVLHPGPDAWEKLPSEVWRVLLERHDQLIRACLANEDAGNQRFTSLPLGLPASARLPGIMLLWLHGMKLPFPVKDRSDYELPVGCPPGSTTLH
jgi:hypothetical protein